MLAALPFAQLFGLTVTLIAPFLAGARVEPVERFHPARVGRHLRSGGITMFAGVPVIHEAVLAALAIRNSQFAPRHSHLSSHG